MVPDSKRYTASPKLEGRALAVTLRSEETCRTRTVPVFRKVAHIERTVAPDPRGQALSPAATSIAGALLAGAGIYGYANAEHLAAMDDGTDARSPDDYRSAGILSGAIGVGLLGVALIDVIRLRDEQTLVGDVDGEPEVREDACRGRATAHQTVTATATATAGALDWRAEATTDAAGLARLALDELPEGAFAGDELRLELRVEDVRVPVAVDADATRELLAALAADPASRVARDRDRRAAAACADQVAAAAAVTIDAGTPASLIAGTEAAWGRARRTCGDRWQPAHEQAQAAFTKRVVATEAERAARQCAEAGASAELELAQRLDADEELELELELLRDSVAARCEGAANADKVAASVAAAGHKAVRARARAQRRELLAAQLSAQLQRNDAVGLRAITVRDAEAAALLREHGEAAGWIRELAAHWIRQLERAAGPAPAALQAQLCASRRLVLGFLGQAAWTQLRADVARRTDVAKGARIAKAMDAGSCP